MNQTASGEAIARLIGARRVVAIVRGLRPDQTIHAARALAEAGIGALEVTFAAETNEAIAENAETIERLRTELGDRVAVGAGTVITPAQLAAAADAGAQFIVSPNTDPAIIEDTRRRGLVSMPGAMTASEAIAAYRAGANFVKLFPAEALGPAYLRALRSPLPQIPFFAVGGIRTENAREYLDAGAAGLGVGGRLVSRALADRCEYQKMADVARALLRVVDGRSE